MGHLEAALHLVTIEECAPELCLRQAYRCIDFTSTVPGHCVETIQGNERLFDAEDVFFYDH